MRFATFVCSLFLFCVVTIVKSQDDDDQWDEVTWGKNVTDEEEDAWLQSQTADYDDAAKLHQEWGENSGWFTPDGKKSDGPKPKIEFLQPKNGDKIYEENIIIEFVVHNVDPKSGVSALLYFGGGNPYTIGDFQNRIHVTVTQLPFGSYSASIVLVDKNRNPMNIEESISFERVSALPMTMEEKRKKAARDNHLDARIFDVTMRYYSAQEKPESFLDRARELVQMAFAGSASIKDIMDVTKEEMSEEEVMMHEAAQLLEQNPSAPIDDVLNAGAGSDVRKTAKPVQVDENGHDDNKSVATSEIKKPLPHVRDEEMNDHLLFVQGVLHLFNRANRDLKTAMPFLSQSAGLGNANAHLFLALLWTIGDPEVGSKVDEDAALYHWKSCAEAGHPVCKMALGYRYLHGFGGVNQSCEDAANNYRAAADVTMAFTTENAGFPPLHKTRLSEYREIQAEDHNEEIEDLETFKAEQGGEGAKEAHLFLGLHRYFGTGKSEGDRTQALKHFEEAADHGSGTALNNLGTIHMNGVGVDQNYSKAFGMFEKSAAMGDHWGVNSLALCYWYGYGVVANKTEGLRLYKIAAAMGNPNAHFNLGVFYREGSKGLKRDYKKAYEHLDFAARHGQADALLAVGIMFRSGEGMEPSCPTAVNCFKQAAEHGPWGALLQEGYRAFKNNDMVGAFFRYAIAAEAGYATAQANVGWLHENGYGRGQLDAMAAAVDMYSLAAEQGDIPSLRKMGDMYFSGNAPSGKDYTKAALYYEKAKDYDEHALFNLAYMYEHGLGVDLDPKMALEIYTSLSESDFDGSLPSRLAIAKMQALHQIQRWGLLPSHDAVTTLWIVGGSVCTFFIAFTVICLQCVLRK